MGGKGSGRKASAKHERCKRCSYDHTVLCPIMDKIVPTDCIDCMWLPKSRIDDVLQLMDGEETGLPVCPYNKGIECEWGNPEDSFMGRPVRGHCICCAWCPKEESKINARHFGEWVMNKCGVQGEVKLWPMK